MPNAPKIRFRFVQLFLVVVLLTTTVACGKQPEYSINQPSRAETQPTPNNSAFEGARAFAHVKALTDIGPVSPDPRGSNELRNTY